MGRYDQKGVHKKVSFSKIILACLKIIIREKLIKCVSSFADFVMKY